ncbi:MAG: heme exporter protein CcmD [Chloroflexi bacterium]|nr:MAG: heme exporter protein CcmD [Chloroflexota bacterium]
MSYLVAAYGLATLMIAGYVYHLVRQARETAARIRELDRERGSARER